jgi:hypothetical protein
MNRLICIGGAVLFVTTAFLLINTFNTTTAYGCNKAGSTNNTNSSSGVNGSSGNTTKSSASTSSNQNFDVDFAVLPPEINSIAPCHSAK